MNPNPYLSPQTDPALRSEPPVLAALVGEDGGMSIDFEIWRDDLVAFTLFHHRHSPSTRGQMRMAMLAVGFIFSIILVFVVGFALQSPELWLLAAAIVIALIVVLPFYGRIHEYRLKEIVERMYGEGRNLLIYGPRRVSLSPQFLNSSSPYTQSVTRWVAIERVVVSADAVYIYNSGVSSVVVPRRAFTSDDHFQTFVHTAQEFHAGALAAENPLRTSL